MVANQLSAARCPELRPVLHLHLYKVSKSSTQKRPRNEFKKPMQNTSLTSQVSSISRKKRQSDFIGLFVVTYDFIGFTLRHLESDCVHLTCILRSFKMPRSPLTSSATFFYSCCCFWRRGGVVVTIIVKYVFPGRPYYICFLAIIFIIDCRPCVFCTI